MKKISGLREFNFFYILSEQIYLSKVIRILVFSALFIFGTSPLCLMQADEKLKTQAGYDLIPPPEFSVVEFTIPSGYTPVGFNSMDSEGNIWFRNTEMGRIGKFDIDNSTFYEYPTIGPLSGGGIGGVDIDSQGNIWFTQWFNEVWIPHKIIKFSPSFLTFIEYPTPMPWVWGNYSSKQSFPMGIIVDQSGIVWFTEFGENMWFWPNRLGRIDPETEIISEYFIPTMNSDPTVIEVDGEGNIWFLEWSKSDRFHPTPANALAKFDPVTEEFAEYVFPSQNVGATDIAADKNNRIWIIEFDVEKLAKFDPAIETFTEYFIPSCGPGIATDENGNIWFTSSSRNIIGRFNQNENTLKEFDVGSVAFNPTLIAIDKQSNVWFLAGNRVFRLTITRIKISAVLDIVPDILNLKSKGKFITCYIELPEDYYVEDIDINSVALTKINDDLLDPPLYSVGPFEIGDYDEDGISDLMVKFDRQGLIPLLEVGDAELTVAGELADETQFEGTDTVRVIDKGKK